VICTMMYGVAAGFFGDGILFVYWSFFLELS
ncbi:MAG: hypothetical protein AVDCRST_MAG95-1329, partial [uncultured Adhaeribacter sp.]